MRALLQIFSHFLQYFCVLLLAEGHYVTKGVNYFTRAARNFVPRPQAVQQRWSVGRRPSNKAGQRLLIIGRRPPLTKGIHPEGLPNTLIMWNSCLCEEFRVMRASGGGGGATWSCLLVVNTQNFALCPIPVFAEVQGALRRDWLDAGR